MKIGIAGLGRMGLAVFERVAELGHKPLAWNRSPHPQATAPTPRALAEQCDVVVSFISGEEANRAVFAGETGLFAAANAPLLINCATLSPGFVRDLAEHARARGARFVEAPVLGTVAPARAGALVALVGGGEADTEAARAPLALFCRAVRPMGEAGAGAAMKIVHNTILSLYWRSVGEAFGFGRAHGLDLNAMVDVIGDSFAANKQWPLKAPVLLGQDETVGFSLAGLAGELAMLEREYAAADTPAPMLALARARAEAAVAAGWGARDVVSVALFAPPSA